MTNILSTLEKHSGTYFGQGTNHEGQSFTGKFQIAPIRGGIGFEISFKATGDDQAVYHEEKSIIAPSVDEKLCLWNFNSNAPAMLPHELRQVEDQGENLTLVFGFCDSTDTSKFREEISLQLWENGEISYTYSWGMPGGEFKERSGVRMSPKENQEKGWPKTLSEKLNRSFVLFSDLIEFIPEDALSQKLPGLPSNTLGQQLWCVIGARTSYLSALRAGEWKGFECPLDWSKTTSKTEIKRTLQATADEAMSFLKVCGNDLSKELFIDLLEHEIQHHGQIIRYLYGLKIGVPDSWKQRYHLD